MLESEVINERYTLLADAETMIADPLVRNMGTVGGAVAHGDPAEDLPAAFTALGGEVVARGPDGERTIPDVDTPEDYEAALARWVSTG